MTTNTQNNVGSQMLYKRKLSDTAILNINHFLLHYNWDPIYDLSTNESYDFLVLVIHKAMDLYAPLKCVKMSSRISFTEPWMTVAFLKQNRKCTKLSKKAKESGRLVDLNRYRDYRRALNVVKRHDKKAFYDRLFTKIGTNTKKLWSILNSLSGKVRNKTDIPSLIYNNKMYSDKQQICDKLNDHFIMAGKKVQNGLSKTKGSQSIENIKRCNVNLSTVCTTEYELDRIVANLQCKHSCGHDGLSNAFIKKIFVSI